MLGYYSHYSDETLLGDDGGSGPGLRLARALLIFFREDLHKSGNKSVKLRTHLLKDISGSTTMEPSVSTPSTLKT